jgi:hypothetical protein
MTNKLSAFIPVLVTLLSLTISNGYANDTPFTDTSFRCGNDIISAGYTMFQVRNECGAPDSEQVVGEIRENSSFGENKLKIDTFAYITEWIYKRDYGIYILTFEGSRLIRKEFVKQ